MNIMKNRPISSTIRRKNIFDETNPLISAKRDLEILSSTSKTSRFIDNKLYTLSQLSQINPLEILSSEVSRQLKALKKHTNSTQIHNASVKSRLKNCSLDLTNVNEAEKIAENREKFLTKKILNLKKNIKEVQDEQLVHISDQKTCLHIKQRLEATKVFLDIRKNELKSDLKSKNLVLAEVQSWKSASAERKTRTLRIHKNLNKSLSFFHQQYEKVSKKLQKDMDLMDFVNSNRDMRTFRQQNIIEQVGINEKNRREKESRENCLLHKMWYLNLTKKLENSMKKFSRIDLAYKKIKSLTGLEDVNIFLSKIFSKEDSLQDLTEHIQINKKKIEEYSNRNAELQKNIKQISVLDKKYLTDDEVGVMNSNIRNLKVRRKIYEDKILGVQGVVDKVKDWCVRMIKMMDANFEYGGEKLFELMKILRFRIQADIKPVRNLPRYDRYAQITANPVSLRKKQRYSLNLNVSLSELNHVDSDSSNSKSYLSILSDRKTRKK